ncbi:ABC transporter permease [Mesorhizobium sp. 113-3-3]|uniref:ABC transporter permease n=1 Tax=Mesorhizobium sp. 113-3-3 TaxID=2744516 RepID=UPI00192640CB|nr:ABC transporter permease [Mesorhizobium sp. 113-3-3]BCG82164.1 ABC transporter permease [Mesorhizobium sp. 113-3-3]
MGHPQVNATRTSQLGFSSEIFLIKGLIAAAYVLPIILILGPFCIFFVISFGRVEASTVVLDFNLSSYIRIFADSTVRMVIGRTLVIGVATAVICTLFGYPAAYLIKILSPKRRPLLMVAFAAPLLMSYVIKIYTIRNLLGTNGVINHFLVASGIVSQPLEFFTLSYYGVFLTLTSVLLPFAVFPIFLSLDRIPKSLVEAAADLGASRTRIFWTVIFPLSLSGVAVSLTFTFVLAIGDFITPELVGGPNGFTLGRIIFSQFGLGFNWPFGAALSTLMMLIVTIALALATRIRPPGKVTF